MNRKGGRSRNGRRRDQESEERDQEGIVVDEKRKHLDA